MNVYHVEVSLDGGTLGFDMQVITAPEYGYRMHTPSTSVYNDTHEVYVYWPQYLSAEHLEACVAEGSLITIHNAIMEFIAGDSAVLQ